MPKKYKSNVVYQFVCAGCNAMYIGETTVHYSTRIHQHFNKGTGPSAVYKHLGKHTGSPSDCRKACDDSTFRIINEASTKYALRLKEGMHIRWHNENSTFCLVFLTPVLAKFCLESLDFLPL